MCNIYYFIYMFYLFIFLKRTVIASVYLCARLVSARNVASLHECYCVTREREKLKPRWSTDDLSVYRLKRKNIGSHRCVVVWSFVLKSPFQTCYTCSSSTWPNITYALAKYFILHSVWYAYSSSSLMFCVL